MVIKTDNIDAEDFPGEAPSERIVGHQASLDDSVLERALRPKQLDEYVGQKKSS